MMSLVYQLLYVLGFMLYLPRALWRRRLPHRGWRMRLGRLPPEVLARAAGTRPVWVHAVSVGEVLAARPLLAALRARAPAEPLVVSTVTPSGFGLARQDMRQAGAAIYLPLDLRVCIERTLRGIHPKALLLMESELWPMLIRGARAFEVPVAVVNGRVSPRTIARARRLTRWMAAQLVQVDRFLMQSELDAERIIALGAPADRVQVTGNLKWDACVGTRPDPAGVEQLAGRLRLNGRDRVLVAGSTHRGEERALLDAARVLAQRGCPVKLILAPRHLERLGEVETLIRECGRASMRLSQAQTADSDWDVGIIDTFGELPRYYGVATVAFIGGSLIPHGGQNPLEAASLGKPVVYGPFMHNFPHICEQLIAGRAAEQLARPDDLARALAALFEDPAGAQAMGRRAQELVARHAGSAGRTLEALQPLLARQHR
ncbi:MAG TPA: 3-deoxy-D-manno-octulosonic acid transferase [bacterium]